MKLQGQKESSGRSAADSKASLEKEIRIYPLNGNLRDLFHKKKASKTIKDKLENESEQKIGVI